MKNSYTKLQANISKDHREKSGKLKCDGRTDRLSDRQRANYYNNNEESPPKKNNFVKRNFSAGGDRKIQGEWLFSMGEIINVGF